MQHQRVEYLDRIKVVLTVMVIAVHAAITYGSEGGWYFTEATDDVFAIVPLTLLSAVSQSFFMSLFFFIAAYFTPSSFDRKGPIRFLRNRLIRLGIPCLLFAFAVGPLTSYMIMWFLEDFEMTYLVSIHIGPLWFAQALLIFSIGYVVVRVVARVASRDIAGVGTRVATPVPGGKDVRETRGSIDTERANPLPAPRLWGLVVAGLTMAALTFAARWAYPMGEGILGMQLGSFAQYIMTFAAGIVAYRNRWLDRLRSMPLRGIAIASAALILSLPVTLFLGADPEVGFAYFLGGPYWQAVVYAVWESAGCIVFSLLLLGFMAQKQVPADDAGTSNNLLTRLAPSAFTVYIIHSAILIALTAAMVGVSAHPLVKFAILLVVGTALSFLLGAHVRRIPLLRRVL